MKRLIAAFLNGLKAPFQVLQALWFAFHGDPLTCAREDHKLAWRALIRAETEVEFHKQLATFFDQQARSMDPHKDWHYFASLKDTWQEHVTEQTVETRRVAEAQARVVAIKQKMRRIEQRQKEQNHAAG